MNDGAKRRGCTLLSLDSGEPQGKFVKFVYFTCNIANLYILFFWPRLFNFGG